MGDGHRIGEFSRRVGVTPELLRAWEQPLSTLQETASATAPSVIVLVSFDTALIKTEAAHAVAQMTNDREGLPASVV